MVCHTVGNPTAVAWVGRTPEGGCHSGGPGAASVRPDRHSGGEGDAGSQAEAVRQLPAKTDRMNRNRARSIGASEHQRAIRARSLEIRERCEQSQARDRRERPWREAKPKVKIVLIGKARNANVEAPRVSRWSAPSGSKNQVRKESPQPVAPLRPPGSSFDENMLQLSPMSHDWGRRDVRAGRPNGPRGGY